MEIKRNGSQPSQKGPSDYFTGTPTTAMTHLAVTEALDGKAVEWLEKVTDEEYLAGKSQEVTR